MKYEIVYRSFLKRFKKDLTGGGGGGGGGVEYSSRWVE